MSKKPLPLFYREPDYPDFIPIKAVAYARDSDAEIIAAVVDYLAVDTAGYQFVVHRYADMINIIGYVGE